MQSAEKEKSEAEADVAAGGICVVEKGSGMHLHFASIAAAGDGLTLARLARGVTLEGKGNRIRMRIGKRKGLLLCSDIHSVGVDRMRIPFAQVLPPLPPGREVRSANTISSGGPGRERL